MTTEIESEELVSMKISKSTHDLLKKAKEQLNVGSIDAAIQCAFRVANTYCWIADDVFLESCIPCECWEIRGERPFNYHKCPSFCPRFKNVKKTHWWQDITNPLYGESRSKEDYTNAELKTHEEDYGREAYEKRIKEAEAEHANDPTYKPGNWRYDFDHMPFEPTPPPSREVFEARFKELVEDKKEAVLRMEKLRGQSLFEEWKKIWKNYPACIEGIKHIEDPWKDV
jgi:hypothetical protein